MYKKWWLYGVLVLGLLPSPLHPILQQYPKTTLEQFCKEWISLVSHEAGHALAIRLGTDATPKIHLGATKNKNSVPIQEDSILTIDSIIPTTGSVRWTDNGTSRITRSLIALAGPLADAFSLYLYNIGKQVITTNRQTWNELFFKALLDPDIFYHLFYNLVPKITLSNDGATIMEQITSKTCSPEDSFKLTSPMLLATTNLVMMILRQKYLHESPRDFESKELIKLLNIVMAKKATSP